MSFDETRLPECIERGAQGGPGFLTNVFVLNSGMEQRNSLWSVDRGRWNIGYGIQTREEALMIRNFFVARRGRARGFRFKDWSNYSTDGVQMPTTDLGGGNYQMRYRYQDAGTFFYEKDIKKPVATPAQSVYVGGVLQASGYTVDTTTGIITFATAPASGAVVTWEGEFDLPVRFDTDNLALTLQTSQHIMALDIPIVELKL